jgi:hypothetical protein
MSEIDASASKVVEVEHKKSKFTEKYLKFKEKRLKIPFKRNTLKMQLRFKENFMRSMSKAIQSFEMVATTSPISYQPVIDTTRP